MYWVVAFNKATLQIEAYASNSAVDLGPLDLMHDLLLDPLTDVVILTDPPFEITRDHALVFDGAKVVGSEPREHPDKPAPELVTDWRSLYQAAGTVAQKTAVVVALVVAQQQLED